jgi:hypothetical protein
MASIKWSELGVDDSVKKQYTKLKGNVTDPLSKLKKFLSYTSTEELKKYHAAYMDPTDEKVIYLTFDAGYENGNTPAILEALKKHDVSATFFVVRAGNSSRRSNFICSPNNSRVPTPVRSPRTSPSSRILSARSRYWSSYPGRIRSDILPLFITYFHPSIQRYFRVI